MAHNIGSLMPKSTPASLVRIRRSSIPALRGTYAALRTREGPSSTKERPPYLFHDLLGCSASQIGFAARRLVTLTYRAVSRCECAVQFSPETDWISLVGLPSHCHWACYAWVDVDDGKVPPLPE